MKNQNQACRKPSKTGTSKQGKNRRTERIRIYMRRALKAAVLKACARMGITPSEFLVQAIEERLLAAKQENKEPRSNES